MNYLSFKIGYGEKTEEVLIPERNFLFCAEPREIPETSDEIENIRESLLNPIGTATLAEILRPGMKVLILSDDQTRLTPKKLILSVLIPHLKEIGIKEEDIEILIALGTHRYLTPAEIITIFGSQVVDTIRVSNHEWADPLRLINLGLTPGGIEILVNEKVRQVDFVIGIGSIVPHSEAGWSGGGKIVQPGISGWETTGATHLLAATDPNFLEIVGTVNNRVRSEIEYIAERAGLGFIINTVLNPSGKIYQTVAGHPVAAHRHGVEFAKELYQCPITEKADIVVINAYPADLDYWQGDKPVTYALRGLKTGGTIILVGRFPEGISQTHPVLEQYGRYNFQELRQLEKDHQIEDRVGLAALYIHAHHKAKASIICVSEGLTPEQKWSLDFIHASRIQEAVNLGLVMRGEDAKIGFINHGGDLLPVSYSKATGSFLG